MSASPESVSAGLPAAAGAPAPAQAAPWYGSDATDDVKSFVAGKGWDSPMKAITSYRELEAFRGVPAERLLKLPEKADAPEWADIRAKVGWKAPEKPEDYEIATPAGYPVEYAQSIAQTAHKLGIPKDALTALATENDKAIQAYQAQQDQTIRSRIDAADASLKQSLGDKHGETMELVQRELTRVGLSPEIVEAVESSLAASDEKGVGAFRQVLIDLALARREAPLHNGATQMAQPSAATATNKLAELGTDAAWVAKALERGTPESKERLRLIMIASGKAPDEAEIERHSRSIFGTM